MSWVHLILAEAVVVVVLGILLSYVVKAGHASWAKASAALIALAGAGLAGYVAEETLVEHTPLAHAALTQGEDGLAVPARSGPTSLVVRGHLPPVNKGVGAAATYQLEVKAGDAVVQRIDGSLDEHWEARRVGRRARAQVAVGRLEHRHDLVDAARDRDLTVKLIKSEGSLVGPLEVDAVPSPPREAVIVALLALLTLLGAVLDARAGKRSQAAPALGVYAGLAFLLLESAGHEEGIGRVVLVCGVSVVLGMAFGGAVGWIVRKIVPEAKQKAPPPGPTVAPA